MKVLLIGSGGREHALAWKIAQSPDLTKLYAAPGNPGIAEEAELVALDTDDHGAVVSFCKDKAIDFVVVGPEAPLVAGIADRLREAGIAVFGPSAAAAQLEGSKGFQGCLRPLQHSDRCLSAFQQCAEGQGLCARTGRADRHQGRRPCRRQGCHGCDDAR